MAPFILWRTLFLTGWLCYCVLGAFSFVVLYSWPPCLPCPPETAPAVSCVCPPLPTIVPWWEVPFIATVMNLKDSPSGPVRLLSVLDSITITKVNDIKANSSKYFIRAFIRN